MIKAKAQAPTKFELLLAVNHLQVREGSWKNTHVIVSVDYDKGGHNPFDQKQWLRGIYCSIGPVAIEKKEHGEMRAFGIQSAPTFLLQEVPRLNRARVGDWFTRVKADLANKTGKAWETLQRVLQRDNMLLKKEFKS